MCSSIRLPPDSCWVNYHIRFIICFSAHAQSVSDSQMEGKGPSQPSKGMAIDTPPLRDAKSAIHCKGTMWVMVQFLSSLTMSICSFVFVKSRTYRSPVIISLPWINIGKPTNICFDKQRPGKQGSNRDLSIQGPDRQNSNISHTYASAASSISTSFPPYALHWTRPSDSVPGSVNASNYQ